MSMFKTLVLTLASDLLAGATLTVAYPKGTDKGNFTGNLAHKMFAMGANYTAPADFTLTFNAGDITLTWGTGKTTIPAGTEVHLQIEQKGDSAVADWDNLRDVIPAHLARIDLGSPLTADDDAYVDAATSTELPNAATVTYTPDTQGTSPTDNSVAKVTVLPDGEKVWELDYPRGIGLAVTHGSSIVAMTAKITGYDEYMKPMTETLSISATGTSKSAAGKKAFKFVRSVAFTSAGNATTNTANVGFTDVLGLPVAVPSVGYVLKELEDDAVPSAGTFVAPDRAVATDTTGDVRGTYDPNSACDGSKGFALVVALTDPNDKGVAQA